MNEFAFEGSSVVVTGGASGIGAAVVAAFLARGANVAVLDVRDSADARAKSFVVDVTDGRGVDAAIDAAAAAHGGLDVVVSCAGITRDAVLWKISDADWDAVLDVNLKGTFLALRAAVPHLRARSRGAVVLVASINGERGKFGQANYSASKAGVIALGKTAAKELGRFGVRVNVVAPGYIETPMTRDLPPEITQRAAAESALGRIGKPEEVADAILFLCSPLARYVTGQVLRVDGGQLT
ncbi:MAG: SDR family oxidoreductase [Planctomycetes bacterium]|nr:SDR family oxidoreductase [Planctomycetota bacterium]